jgi:hypothetical protein
MTRQQPPWHYGVILTCALLATLPLFLTGPSCGHDFEFHLQSWLAASTAWHRLPAWPHWVSAANYGAGEPRFVFYPPLSWTLGALLGSAFPWTLVPQALTLLALAGCGIAFYQLALGWVRPTLAAAAACVYLANPYLLFVAYERTAYGELLGAISIPLILRYALRRRPALISLALVVDLLWLTNAPAAVMGCYLLVACAGAAAVSARSLQPALRSIVALALGTGAASVYVLPAWYEQRWVEITRVVGAGMRVEDSFLFAHTGEPFHDQVLHTASSIAVALVGAGLIAGLCAAAACWAGLRATGRDGLVQAKAAGPIPTTAAAPRGVVPPEPLHRLLRLSAFLTILLLAILALLLPGSDPAWRLAPELRFLQFPWRWLLVAGVASTLAAAAAAEAVGVWWRPVRASGSPPASSANASGRRQVSRILAAMSLVAALFAGAWSAGRYAQHHYAQVCDDEDNVRAQQALLLPVGPDPDTGAVRPSSRFQIAGAAAPAGFEGTDEYTPAGADNGEIQQGLPAVRLLAAPEDDEGDDAAAPNPEWQPPALRPPGWSGANENCSVRVDTWTPEHKRFTVTAPRPLYAVLRLMDYPAWVVRINGRIAPQRLRREDGLLTLPVPQGTTSIDVLYESTPDVYAGRALSILSLLMLVTIAAWPTRRQPGR